MVALVERVVHTIAGTGEQQPRAVGIIAHAAHIGQSVLGQVAIDPLPGLAVIGRLVDERVAVVREMQIDADIGAGRIKARGRNAGDRAPGWKTRHLAGDVDPAARRVFAVPDLAVIGAGPDESLLNLGGRDRKHDFAVELTEIVANDAARWHEMGGILRGQIGAHH